MERGELLRRLHCVRRPKDLRALARADVHVSASLCALLRLFSFGAPRLPFTGSSFCFGALPPFFFFFFSDSLSRYTSAESLCSTGSSFFFLQMFFIRVMVGFERERDGKRDRKRIASDRTFFNLAGVLGKCAVWWIASFYDIER